MEDFDEIETVRFRGMDVVDKIAKVKTSSRGYYDDVPETPVVIEKAEILPD